MNALSAPEIEQLVESIKNKKKYSQIDEGLIRDVVRLESEKGRKHKEIEKAVLAKLHQVGAAYFAQIPDYAGWLTELERLPDDLQAQPTRDYCLRLMQSHHSTQERLFILQDFFMTTLASIQPVASILDLACGLNPLALPWMPVQRDIAYYGCDIFRDMTDYLQSFARYFHLAGDFRTCNIFTDTFSQPVQVAFLLKTLPCLEQVYKGFAAELLARIPAQYILVSYPISSLSGKGKGMRETYTQQFETLMAQTGWPFEPFTFTHEIAFLVHKG